jgi:hypothetical protein
LATKSIVNCVWIFDLWIFQAIGTQSGSG